MVTGDFTPKREERTARPATKKRDLSIAGEGKKDVPNDSRLASCSASLSAIYEVQPVEAAEAIPDIFS